MKEKRPRQSNAVDKGMAASCSQSVPAASSTEGNGHFTICDGATLAELARSSRFRTIVAARARHYRLDGSAAEDIGQEVLQLIATELSSGEVIRNPWPHVDVVAWRKAKNHRRALDRFPAESLDVVADREEMPQEQFNRESEKLDAIISTFCLTPEERFVIKHRFDYKATLRELADEGGLSITQIHRQQICALEKVRATMGNWRASLLSLDKSILFLLANLVAATGDFPERCRAVESHPIDQHVLYLNVLFYPPVPDDNPESFKCQTREVLATASLDPYKSTACECRWSFRPIDSCGAKLRSFVESRIYEALLYRKALRTGSSR